MVFLEFLVFLEFMETSEVAGPGPNPREIEISFGADGPLACVRHTVGTLCANTAPERCWNVLTARSGRCWHKVF